MLVLVAATSFLFAALPRLFNEFADDGLRYTIAQAPFGERNPSFAEAGRIPASASGDPLANVVARTGQAQHEVLPAALDELVDRHAVVVRSPMYAAPASAGIAPFVTLRVPAAGFEDAVRVVAGRLPRARDERVSTVITTVPDRPRPARVPVIEIALSTNTARELEAHVGERRILAPPPSEVQARRVPQHDQRPIAVQIVGLFDVTDPNAPFWFGDPTVDRPNLEFTPDLEREVRVRASHRRPCGISGRARRDEPLPAPLRAPLRPRRTADRRRSRLVVARRRRARSTRGTRAPGRSSPR